MGGGGLKHIPWVVGRGSGLAYEYDSAFFTASALRTEVEMRWKRVTG